MQRYSEKRYFYPYKVSHRRASNRVNRGGSWNNNPQNCRAANRNNNRPANRNNNVGFRLAL
ncbi:MAG: SUMF1/EgtB/PvdO family nonheme iron enzyme [bacterium]|nr:SUMF1/EgtB/PvdO family nonheme iron enzyme [bacterium]